VVDLLCLQFRCRVGPRRECWSGANRVLATVLLALSLLPFPAFPAHAAQKVFPCIFDSEIERLVSDYARPIFTAAGLDPKQINICVANSTAYKAFVLRSGDLFLSKKAFLEFATANQVVGLIAHDLGHVLAGHNPKGREALRVCLDSIFRGDSLEPSFLHCSEIWRSATVGPISLDLFGYHSAEEEQEADQIAHSLLLAAKRSTRGLLDVFERLGEQEYIKDPTIRDHLVGVHPATERRLKTLRELARGSPHFNEVDSFDKQLRHDLVRAKVVGLLEPRGLVLKRYPDIDQSLVARYARANTLLGSGYWQVPIELALSIQPEIEGLIREKSDHAYFWSLNAEILLRSGNAAQAIGVANKALALHGDGASIRLLLALSLIASDDPWAAHKHIDDLMHAMSGRKLWRGPVFERLKSAHRRLAEKLEAGGRSAEALLARAFEYSYSDDPKAAAVAEATAKSARAKLDRRSLAWQLSDQLANATSSKKRP